MKKILLPLTFFCLSFQLFAGIPPYGKVTLDELKNEYCPFDSAAGAYYIYDYGKVDFIGDFGEIERYAKRKARIKIIDQSMVQHGDLRIMMSGPGHVNTLQDVELTCYNLEDDGSISSTTVTKKDAQINEISPTMRIYSIPAPNVREGSVIEYKYTIKSMRPFIEDWHFQKEIPVETSRLTLEVNHLYSYVFMKQGDYNFDLDTSYIEELKFKYMHRAHPVMVNIFEVSNIPPLVNEPFCLNPNNYRYALIPQLSKINLNRMNRSFLTTWEEVSKTLYSTDGFGGFVGSRRELYKMAKPFDTIKDIKQRTEAVVNYVKSNFTWQGYFSINSNLSLNDVLERKAGNSVELNLLLKELLYACEIPSYAVALSNREFGQIVYEYPFIDQLNNIVVIAEMDGDRVLLDATNDDLDWNLIPPSCVNEYGLVIDGKEPANFVSLTPKTQSKKQTTTQISLHEEKMMFTGEFRVKCTGYEKLKMRTELSKGGYNNLHNSIQDSWHDTQLDSMFLANSGDDGAFEVHGKLKVNAEQIGDRILIWPVLFEPILISPFKEGKRTLPIEVENALTSSDMLSIEIPDGYKVEELPESFSVALEDKSLIAMFKTSVSGNRINVLSSVYIKQNFYPVSQYDGIVKIFNKLASSHNKRISLIPDDSMN